MQSARPEPASSLAWTTSARNISGGKMTSRQQSPPSRSSRGTGACSASSRCCSCLTGTTLSRQEGCPCVLDAVVDQGHGFQTCYPQAVPYHGLPDVRRVTCIRIKHAVSVHSQYQYRSVQIVFRLYSSIAEALAGFDINAPCDYILYNGNCVFANPRAITAMMRRCNTIDSCTFQNVYRPDIDPSIYQRAIGRITGLGRLLVLEKHTDADARFNFLESQRTLRGQLNRYSRRKPEAGTRATLRPRQALAGSRRTTNDYDVASLHILYRPGWDAQRIDRLVSQTDLGVNCLSSATARLFSGPSKSALRTVARCP
uniref:Uncharacterized protein n=1 Tax=Mycena chlorophos TaxID=658473 RepID=A0ABQ0KX90_MYCCL|nr:predicted protein [Mycena chlorophos]